MKFMGDFPFSIYFDLGTTTGKKVYNFDEDATLYPISYAFVIAFHPSLNIEKISVIRSFNHTFEQLNEVNYLKDEMLPFVDPITTRQLRDSATAAFIKKQKCSLTEMFSCKLKFVIDLLKKWLAENFFNRYKELNMLTKQRFKRQNPINWESTNCVICGLCLPTAASNFPSEKITTFLYFVIEKEHSFIRNFFDPEDITLSKNIETLKKYDASFKKILRIVVVLNDNYSKDIKVGDISDDCIAEFIEEYEFESFEGLYLDIENTQVKNAMNKFEIKTVVSKDVFSNVRD